MTSSLHEPTGMTKYASSIAASLSVEEMRELHRQALAEAEAKQTELRIVLASRYRDLVGSSEQVLDMRHSAEELDSKIRSLPVRMEQLRMLLETPVDYFQDTLANRPARTSKDTWRARLFQLPKLIYSRIDAKDLLGTATAILELLALVQRFDPNQQDKTDYPLAWAMLRNKQYPSQQDTDDEDDGDDDFQHLKQDPIFQTQMKMTYLQLQTIPKRIIRLAKDGLLQPSEILAVSDSRIKHGVFIHARTSACALAAYDLMTLRLHSHQDPRDQRLLDLYLSSKALLIQQLLNLFSQSSSPSDTTEINNLPKNAEDILLLIVSVLQYDVILHSYHIFIQRRFLSDSDSINIKLQDEQRFIMSTLPHFDPEMVKGKVSHFLAVHLHLIRAKAKSVLASISTASRLGNIRQLLYDKTDGADILKSLTHHHLGSWEDAVLALVDTRMVFQALEGSNHPHLSITSFTTLSSPLGQEPQEASSNTKKFSLWNCLFSNVFSSLVHSILTSSFQSVHSRVISTLRSSLACAPPYPALLAHEAHRNTVRIAWELDLALKKLSDDAHELLVHAEEREESERRLRDSLYVHTCEIMGRLIHEIRRILYHSQTIAKDNGKEDEQDEEEATKLCIVGRLCHVLRFRLSTLSNLLQPFHLSSSLETVQRSAMITTAELQSAFSIADDNDDGLISVDEAMDVMESAFSGTSFHGAKMVRETLLLDSTSAGEPASYEIAGADRHRNVTLQELILLGARGLKLATRGDDSALGTIQHSLDDIVNLCFSQWSKKVLRSSIVDLKRHMSNFITTASSVSNEEWMRLHHIPMNSVEAFFKTDASVSPYLISFLLSVSFLLNQSICPADSLPPILSSDSATTLEAGKVKTLTLTCILRRILLSQALDALYDIWASQILPQPCGKSCVEDMCTCPAALLQLHLDLTFIRFCDSICRVDVDSSIGNEPSTTLRFDELEKELWQILLKGPIHAPIDLWKDRQCHVLFSIDLFMKLLSGESDSFAYTTASGNVVSEVDRQSSDAMNLYLQPLSSSCRFNLLPVQTDRSLSELQVLGKLERDQKNKMVPRRLESIPGSMAANAVSSGLGFLSSMLGKK